MALNQLGLGFLFTARDEASHIVAKLERSLGKLNATQKKAAMGALVPGALGAGGMLGGIKALKEAFDIAREGGQFQQKLADISSITGVTSEKLQELRSSVISVGLKSQYGPEEAIDSFRRLAQSGFEANDAIKLLQPTLQFAAGSLGQLNPETAGATIVQAIKAFGLEASQAGEVADKMLSLHRFSDAQFRELPMLIGRASRGAASYGASLDDVLVIAGLARNTLGSMNIAATSTSVAFERMINPKFRKGIEALGINVVDTTGKFRAFPAILKDLLTNTKYQNMSWVQQKELLQKVFGRYGMGAVGSVLKQVTDGVKTLSGEVKYGTAALDYLLSIPAKSKGLSALFANQRLDNLEGQLQLFQSAWKTLRTVVGEQLANIFKPAVQWIRDGIVSLVEAWEKLSPATKQGIVKAALAVMGLVTAFGALVAMKAGFVVLSGVLAALGTTLGGVALSMAPVLVGLLLFAGVAYLVYRAYKTNFGGLGDFIDGTWKKISLAVHGLGQLFSQGYLSGAVMDEVDKTKNKGIKDFIATIWMWTGRIKNFFSGLVSGFQSMWPAIKPAVGAVLEALKGLGEVFGVSVGEAGKNASVFEQFGKAGESVGYVLGTVVVEGLRLAIFSITLLTKAVKFGEAVWNSFSGQLAGGARFILGAFELVFGVLSGDSKMFWRGVVDAAVGAVKVILSIIFAMARASAKALKFIPGFGEVASLGAGKAINAVEGSSLSVVDAARNNWMAELDNGSGKPGTGASTSSPAEAKSAFSASPGVAQQEALKETMSAAFKDAMTTMAKTNAQSWAAGASGSVASKLQLNVDGHELGSIMLDFMKKNASQSYQTPTAESP